MHKGSLSSTLPALVTCFFGNNHSDRCEVKSHCGFALHFPNSSTLATSCEELTHWKRLWCWEGVGAGGKGDDRGWDGWMASLTLWRLVWVNSWSWWWTGRPGVLRFMGSQRVGHDWATELNWNCTAALSAVKIYQFSSKSIGDIIVLLIFWILYY